MNIEKLLIALDAELLKLRQTATDNDLSRDEQNEVYAAMQGVLLELKRIEKMKERLEDLLDAHLHELGKGVPEGEYIFIGNYKYSKSKNKGQSKLDPEKLSQMVPDQDILDLCYRTERKPLTQAQLKDHLAQNGFNIDVRTLYGSEEKPGFNYKLSK
jgi:hypothetical protein